VPIYLHVTCAPNGPQRNESILRSRSLLTLPRRIAANWGLLKALTILAITSDNERRSQALTRIASIVRAKEIEASMSRGVASAKKFARTLLNELPDIAEHLRLTPHLGALQPLAAHALTRIAYTSLQLELLLRLKKEQKGLGLGSYGGGKSSIQFRGDPLTGLELAQTWSILLSWGHLFGTFSTERALLYHLRKEPGAMDEFLAAIDPRLRPQVAAIVESESMYKFVHALTALRVSKASMSSEIRETLIASLALYLDRSDDVRSARLRRVFSTVRQLSYVSLHQSLNLPRIEVGSDLLTVPQELIVEDGISYDPFLGASTPLSRLLDSLDVFQYEVFFTGAASDAIVLQHLKEFRSWWMDAAARKEPVVQRISRLWSEPTDWPHLPKHNLRSVLRLKIPLSRTKWVEEVRQWHADGTPWATSSFLLSYPPKGEVGTCNVLGSGHLPSETVYKIAARLAVHVAASWKSEQPNSPSQALWRSVAGFGQHLLSTEVAGLEVVVRPFKAQEGAVGFAAISESPVELAQRIRLVASRCSAQTASRGAELSVLAEYLSQRIPDGRIHLAFLGQVLLVERASFVEVHELDGVIASIGREGVSWEFLEMKGGKAGPQRQLRTLAKSLKRKARLQDEVQLVGQRVGLLLLP
jgi:hypothetical protein